MENTNVGDYENTGWDLVANSVGAITAATIIYFGGKKSVQPLAASRNA